MNVVTKLQPRLRPEPLLSLSDVEKLVRIKKSTIYALMKRGEFPHCVQVTPRTVGWPESRVAEWVQSRIAAADAAAAAAAGNLLQQTGQAGASKAGQP